MQATSISKGRVRIVKCTSISYVLWGIASVFKITFGALFADKRQRFVKDSCAPFALWARSHNCCSFAMSVPVIILQSQPLIQLEKKHTMYVHWFLLFPNIANYILSTVHDAVYPKIFSFGLLQKVTAWVLAKLQRKNQWNIFIARSLERTLFYAHALLSARSFKRTLF